MRADHNAASANLGHGILGWVFAFDLLPFRLLGFGPVSHENAVAEPFLLRSFQGGKEDGTTI